jgi:hypothetical protein
MRIRRIPNACTYFVVSTLNPCRSIVDLSGHPFSIHTSMHGLARRHAQHVESKCPRKMDISSKMVRMWSVAGLPFSGKRERNHCIGMATVTGTILLGSQEKGQETTEALHGPKSKADVAVGEGATRDGICSDGSQYGWTNYVPVAAARSRCMQCTRKIM